MLVDKTRVQLCHGRTPLEFLPNLTRSLGGPNIFIKRDDCSGFATGGNKGRKLEYLVADAIAKGATHLLTTGAVQSNHVRQTAAAAAKMGLRCLALLEDKVDVPTDAYQHNGNRLLTDIFGSEVKTYPAGTNMAEVVQQQVSILQMRGFVPYVVPMGGSTAVGNLGYVSCAEELMAQAKEQGFDIDHLVVTTGSGGTHAGLLAGLLALKSKTRLTGISIMGTHQGQTDLVKRQTAETLELIGAGDSYDPGAVRVEDGYVGASYGIPTDAGLAAISRLAREEAILLDPVYTGKAMSGLIDLVEQGRFAKSDNIVFLHTGGYVGLFAYADTFLK
ncbi:D-cysteine desulfhydrase [Pseudomonas sp. RAC1]|uniref:D-cysteine desulfhydrase n=1 Tax=Pseudomonas sp. RAC1 TaxID=3064900 RepID=UPI00271BA6B0|nr:D-cysteine desulfhydrase [Pseudomonas sp. RAC1]MDV9033042.1 D-cysteine desulfhydrase [Pseudomonas sp. RAC1]